MAKDYTELDQDILDAINLFEGVPTAYNLSQQGGGPLEYQPERILKRLKRNSALQDALEQKGISHVQKLDMETFNEKSISTLWTTVPSKVRAAIDSRLDAHIIEAIMSFDGIPTVYNLSASAGGTLAYGPDLLKRRRKLNPAIDKAIISRGIGFVQTCELGVFETFANNPKWTNVHAEVKRAITMRLDEQIQDVMKSYKGIPTPHNLSERGGGLLRYSPVFVRRRLKENSKLGELIELVGIGFVNSLDRAGFDAVVTSNQYGIVPDGVRAAIYERLDSYILEAIRLSSGKPSTKKLSKKLGGPLEYSHTTISERINANPELRREYYLKRGLNEDQINALEAEHDSSTPAFRQSIRTRLPNTRVFREALGVLSEFKDQLQGKLLEISFYPQPIQRAADFLGIPVDGNLVRAQELKDPDFGITEKFDSLAFIQCCHRISNDSLIRAFNEANNALAEAGLVLVTLPEEYSRTAAFETQVQDFGFGIQTEGTLFTRTLGLEELRAAGVPDPERVKQKVEQATNVILLVKTRAAQGTSLDSFTKSKQENGNGTFHPSLGEINTPDNLLRDLATIFQRATPGIGEGYLLSILDGSGAEKDLIGFDLNPKEPGMVELTSADNPAISIEELSQLARRMSKSSFRERMLVRPGRETKVPASFARMALRAA